LHLLVAIGLREAEEFGGFIYLLLETFPVGDLLFSRVELF
jgi:hypothetical protein